MKHDSSTTVPSARNVQRLGLEDFAQLFGTSANDLPQECVKIIQKANFAYREVEGKERDKVILSVLKRISSEELTVAGDEGARARWEKGWSENLQSLTRKNFDPSVLVPKYIRPNQAVRLNQEYVMPQDSRFELNWYRVFTYWLFQKYFEKVDAIYEFGCGSGINIAILAQMFPDKKLVGLDWAVASKKVLDNLAKAHGWNVEGRVFDFFKPGGGLKLLENSAVLTVGALEQTGLRYRAFLDYLLKTSPSICVNIEPICEWYDENNAVDYLAIMFHRRRGYWEGFPTLLKELEDDGKVEILKMKRSYFGSLFIEGYSQSIWKPTGEGS